jgi:hypothetical protein
MSLKRAESAGASLRLSPASNIRPSPTGSSNQQRRRKQTQLASVDKRECKTDSVSWLEAVVGQACPQAGPSLGSLILQLPGEEAGLS